MLYWNPWYTEPCYKGSLLYTKMALYLLMLPCPHPWHEKGSLLLLLVYQDGIVSFDAAMSSSLTWEGFPPIATGIPGWHCIFWCCHVLIPDMWRVTSYCYWYTRMALYLLMLPCPHPWHEKGSLLLLLVYQDGIVWFDAAMSSSLTWEGFPPIATGIPGWHCMVWCCHVLIPDMRRVPSYCYLPTWLPHAHCIFDVGHAWNAASCVECCLRGALPSPCACNIALGLLPAPSLPAAVWEQRPGASLAQTPLPSSYVSPPWSSTAAHLSEKSTQVIRNCVREYLAQCMCLGQGRQEWC